MTYFPEVVQVVPDADYTVYVYFSDGKIVAYDMKPYLESGVFRVLKDTGFFEERCTIMNDTLAWDVAGNGDPGKCIDIDPETLYACAPVEDRLEGRSLVNCL